MNTTVYGRVFFGFAFLLFVIVVGTAGYMLIEGWPLLDAVYMTLTTITTVGFSEVRPLDTSGRVYTMLLMLFGIGAAFYILTAFVAAIIEGDLSVLYGARRRRAAIQNLEGHYIICGYGRVGEQVARELHQRKTGMVVIDTSTESLERARDAGALTVQGDATAEDVLVEAGIGRAHALIAAADSDAVNTFITLTARSLNQSVFIVTRVSSLAVETKLRQAGANRVVSPYEIGGRRMALAAVQPMMTDFIDVVAKDSRDDRILAEFSIDGASGLTGRTIADALSSCSDVVALAVRGVSGSLTVAPAASTVLSEGDRLMVVGDEDQLRSIGALVRSQ